ncbi:MAG: hypothetical protein EXQ47_11260 [Bryobacterales bacterium]|nr:hypothetical protein [Bryobacterales bacterium]
MAGQKEQNFKNHARLDPAFHGFLTLMGLAMLIGAITYVVQEPGWVSAAHLLTVIWVIALQFKVRLYALKVQDRLIRLEERLRLAQILPESLRGRIGELSEAQLIGLRFASDGELAGLAQRALEEQLGAKQIKEAVRHWRPDYWRV